MIMGNILKRNREIKVIALIITDLAFLNSAPKCSELHIDMLANSHQ